MANIAINGLGRVGRAALKIIEGTDGAEVIAVNDLIPADNLAYLLRYDTVYGGWHKTVAAAGDSLVIAGRAVPVLAKRDPAGLPWGDLGVDLVLECTGAFRRCCGPYCWVSSCLSPPAPCGPRAISTPAGIPRRNPRHASRPARA